MDEGVIEHAALNWLQGLGYELRHGPEIATDKPGSERSDYHQIVLNARLLRAMKRLNAGVPPAAIEDAFRKLTRSDSPSLIQNNHAVHRYFVEGVPVEYQREDGSMSDEFLSDMRGMPRKNLAVEMLRKLLEGEIKSRSRKNIVQSRSFTEMLKKALTKYRNRAIETAQVIEEMIALAREIRDAQQRGEQLGLTEDEVAFYDALEVNDNAVKVLGDDALRAIAQELVKSVKGSVTIDWTVREDVRAKMRVMIKSILRRYGYPPDKQARATELVLEQAAVLCKDWSADV